MTLFAGLLAGIVIGAVIGFLLTRNRVAVATERARGAELMRTLRGLVRHGATVVLTTHNPLDAERCDKVVVLGEGGYLVFSGTPEEARVHFGVATFGDVLLAGLGRGVECT